MNILKISNLNYSIEIQSILSDFELVAKSGDCIAITGDSGCGKSSLLKCLAGLVQPQSGNLEFLEHNIDLSHTLPKTQLRAMRKNVGYVFQSYALWPHMTVLEQLVAAPLFVKKQDKQSVISQAQQLLTQVNLSDHQHLLPEQLSGGQQQRVAILRCLMMNPNIILLDEPTAALDSSNCQQIGKIFQELAQQGKIIIFVSHDLAFVDQFATRTIHLSDKCSPYKQIPFEIDTIEAHS